MGAYDAPSPPRGLTHSSATGLCRRPSDELTGVRSCRRGVWERRRRILVFRKHSNAAPGWPSGTAPLLRICAAIQRRVPGSQPTSVAIETVCQERNLTGVPTAVGVDCRVNFCYPARRSCAHAPLGVWLPVRRSDFPEFVAPGSSPPSRRGLVVWSSPTTQPCSQGWHLSSTTSRHAIPSARVPSVALAGPGLRG
jgi:hypothetical protein